MNQLAVSGISVSIAVGALFALAVSLFAISKIGDGCLYHRRRIEHIPHVWALIAGSADLAFLVSAGAGSLCIYSFSLLLALIGYGAASPALDYLWCAGHLPNSLK